MVVDAYKKDLAIELRCDAEGQPPPEISWFFGEEELHESPHYCLPDNGSLIIVDMTSSLSGEYLCKARNLVGSANATVELRYAGEWCHVD